MLPPEQMRELYTIAKDAGAKDVTWVDFADAHHMGVQTHRAIFQAFLVLWLQPPAYRLC